MELMVNTEKQNHRFRLLTAYRTLIRILISFGWIQIVGYFLGTQWQAQKMNSAQVRNARRLKESILELKGLFIKVGNLLVL